MLGDHRIYFGLDGLGTVDGLISRQVAAKLEKGLMAHRGMSKGQYFC